MSRTEKSSFPLTNRHSSKPGIFLNLTPRGLFRRAVLSQGPGEQQADHSEGGAVLPLYARI